MSDSIVLFSHDGYGLGHLRRNVLLAKALVASDPQVRPVIVTGIARTPEWLADPAFDVVRIPSLVKDASGAYANETMSITHAVEARGKAFERVIAEFAPQSVIIDRHPLGIAGELRRGLSAASRHGAHITLGLRDILDDPSAVRFEIRGDDWKLAPAFYDQVLVYGHQTLCDHVIEYAAPFSPTYCGWVVDPVAPETIDPHLVVVTAGGGGDGEEIISLGIDLVASRDTTRALIVAGPYAEQHAQDLPSELAERITIVGSVRHCAPLYARAGMVIQMAGYNSVAESLSAGAKPLLLPRRAPRREQAIRAARLSALGLADIVDHGSTGAELQWWLDRPRRLAPDALSRHGLHLFGAQVAAGQVLDQTTSIAA